MRVAEMLATLPNNHRTNLERLKADIARFNEMAKDEHASIKYDTLIREYKGVAKGYIRCLVECGVIDNFKTAWCWFTTPSGGSKIKEV